MNRERWERVQEIFHRASGLEGEARARLLDGACGEDAELRGLVESMLDVPIASEFVEPLPEEQLLRRLRDAALDVEGHTFGDFEIGSELGRGAMGVVFRARQISLGRDVAIKVLAPTVQENELAVERFRREALAASRLHHAGIVPILSAGQEGHLRWYAMELVDGWSLRQALAGEADVDLRHPRTAARLVAQVAEALAHSHDHNILHRDVKPENILIDRGGSPRLIDFGLAQLIDLDALSRTGQAAGTPLYMSPEQVEAVRGTVDHRTDVYSAGAVLYEMLTGSPPFPGRSYHEVLHGITHGRLVPVRDRAPGVPRDLARVCEKALERDRSRRYPDARAFAEDLERFGRGETVEARGPGVARRLGAMVTRRGLLQGGALAVVAGAMIRHGVVRAAEQRTVTVTIRGGRGPFTVAWAPSSPLESTSPLFQLRTTRRVVALRVPLEAGRLIVVDPEGACSERWLGFDVQEDVDVVAAVRTIEEVAAGMVPMEGGWAEVSGPGWSDEFARPHGMIRARVSHGPFLIDEACVTNGEYLAFREATGREAPARWGLLDQPDDFLDLPVVSIWPEEAHAYAAHVGKRLPTLAEWFTATGGTDVPPEWAGPQSPFVLGRPRQIPGDPVMDTAYLAYVEPAREATLTPRGLYHPFGNVFEMLEGRIGKAMIQAGHPWHSDPSMLPSMAYFPFAAEYSTDRGFRCARSLEPLWSPTP